jgi:hypothetical protein
MHDCGVYVLDFAARLCRAAARLKAASDVVLDCRAVEVCAKFTTPEDASKLRTDIADMVEAARSGVPDHDSDAADGSEDVE